MKITVCGKGGCGKSTVSALLAKEFERMGKTVLVADSDESNYGLHRQLENFQETLQSILAVRRKLLKQ